MNSESSCYDAKVSEGWHHSTKDAYNNLIFRYVFRKLTPTNRILIVDILGSFFMLKSNQTNIARRFRENFRDFTTSKLDCLKSSLIRSLAVEKRGQDTVLKDQLYCS